MTIKNAFVSRYDGGWLVEADYKQLEIRVLALATEDPQLIDDINSGIDLHRYFASQIFNKPEDDITPEERKMAKGFSFQLQYGAGAKSIAKYWDVNIAYVRKFIDKYYTRYPVVKNWQDGNITWVKGIATYEGAMVSNTTGSAPEAVRTSVIPSIWPESKWGDYALNERFYPGNPKPVFPTTQIKNFPIQGGAADIMLLMLNHLRQRWIHLDDLFNNGILINTVHDSFLSDVQLGGLASYIKTLGPVLESVPELLHHTFGITSPISFPIDISVGHTWADLQPVDNHGDW